MGRKMLPGTRVCWNQTQSGGMMVSRGSSPKGALICVILSHSLKFRNQETYSFRETSLILMDLWHTGLK